MGYHSIYSCLQFLSINVSYSLQCIDLSPPQLNLFLGTLLFFYAIFSGVDFLIHFSDSPLLAYRNAAVKLQGPLTTSSIRTPIPRLPFFCVPSSSAFLYFYLYASALIKMTYIFNFIQRTCLQQYGDLKTSLAVKMF